MIKFLYILTYSLQFTGLLILSERIYFITKSSIIKKYSDACRALFMKNDKVYIPKEDYISQAVNLSKIIVGTLYTILGFFLTIFEFNEEISLINRLSYFVILTIVLFLIYYLVKKLTFLILSYKYRKTKKIVLDNYAFPDGTIAFDIDSQE